jgi:hypothetical protein
VGTPGQFSGKSPRYCDSWRAENDETENYVYAIAPP